MADPVLAVQNLSKYFYIHALGRKVTAFENLSFTLGAGEFKLIRGANGVGKSSLLRCIYRSYRPTAGKITFYSSKGPVNLAQAADEDIALLRKSEIGYVSQFLKPRPRVSALELVAEPLMDLGVGREEAIEEARHWLQVLGLKPTLWEAFPATFSGGEQQKVNLARGLIRPNRLLLLDEPTASLDLEARQAVAAHLKRLVQQGVGLLGVFHHPEEVASLVSQEILLSVPAQPLAG